MEIWETVATRRSVLFVVHNGTTLDRLLDVFGVFEGDMRVQIMVTSDLSDPFADGLPEQVGALGLPSLPWSQATRTTFDLIVSASHHGALAELSGPLVILAHGSGYGKYAPGGGRRSVFGLAPQWLLRDGEPAARALGFAHADEISRVAREVPQALPAAELIGDPTYDRMLAGLPERRECRAGFAAGDDRTVVAVSTTWGGRSLLGTHPRLLRELVAGLPADRFRVLLIAHPNVWSWHGPYQLRLWLADSLREGLIVVPPLDRWRAAIVAADCVIGDHGSVTVYGAALGRPTLLAAFPDRDVVEGSPAHALGRLAGRIEDQVPLAGQIDKAMENADPRRFAAVAGLVSSVPGEARARLSAVCYRLLDLAEPTC